VAAIHPHIPTLSYINYRWGGEGERVPKGRRKKKNGRNDSRKTAAVESTPSGQPLATNENTAFRSRVSLTIYSYRARTCDPDGVSGKAAIDALVHCGVLSDDTTKEIAEIRYPAPIKVKNAEDEKTVIVIEEI